MHFTDRMGIPVNIPGRCLYRYILSMTYKTVWQTLETVKLGRDGEGDKRMLPLQLSICDQLPLRSIQRLTVVYISDQLPGMLVNCYLINCVSKLWSIVNVHLNKAVIVSTIIFNKLALIDKTKGASCLLSWLRLTPISAYILGSMNSVLLVHTIKNINTLLCFVLYLYIVGFLKFCL